MFLLFVLKFILFFSSAKEVTPSAFTSVTFASSAMAPGIRWLSSEHCFGAPLHAVRPHLERDLGSDFALSRSNAGESNFRCTCRDSEWTEAFGQVHGRRSLWSLFFAGLLVFMQTLLDRRLRATIDLLKLDNNFAHPDIGVICGQLAPRGKSVFVPDIRVFSSVRYTSCAQTSRRHTCVLDICPILGARSSFESTG